VGHAQSPAPARQTYCSLPQRYSRSELAYDLKQKPVFKKMNFLIFVFKTLFEEGNNIKLKVNLLSELL